jgi:PAS domain S-box-containing protein
MTGLPSIGGDVEGALESVSVPSYALDASGIIRWINPAAERLVGDVRGRHFTSVVAPEDRVRAREVFSRKVLGSAAATDVQTVLVATDGRRIAVEISSVPLRNGDRVVGVFGLLAGPLEEEPAAPHPHLTPRQAQVLELLRQGRSTKQIAVELQLSPETVSNHTRHVFRTLGVNSRLEAVAVARRGGWTLEPALRHVAGAARAVTRSQHEKIPASVGFRRAGRCPDPSGIGRRRYGLGGRAGDEPGRAT